MEQLSFSFVGKKASRPKAQLLKWIGNKFRFAREIVDLFPKKYNRFIEPFVGTGAVLATLQPKRAIASDAFVPLIEFWNLIKYDPEALVEHYKLEISRFNKNREQVYYEIRDRFNEDHNPYDMLFLSRTCYGGVMRFRQQDGFMSTPIGPHKPVPPDQFAKRVNDWRNRVKDTEFYVLDFREAFELVKSGDIVYCDPPYFDTQRILYRAQGFSFHDLYGVIREAKERGARVALSIDGSKKSSSNLIDVGIPEDLFEKELLIDCGKSMLRRFQKNGLTMKGEGVRDRLLLTW